MTIGEEMAVRSLFRARLLALELARYDGAILADEGVLKRVSGSFVDDGFEAGDTVTVTGLQADPITLCAVAVTPQALQFDAFLENASGTGSVVAGLLPQRAWEGDTYQPMPAVPWLDETMQIVSQLPVSYGSGVKVQHRLLCTVNLHYPRVRGTYEIERMAAGIRRWFPIGYRLGNAPHDIIVQRSERRSLYHDALWSNVPVLVTLAAHELS